MAGQTNAKMLLLNSTSETKSLLVNVASPEDSAMAECEPEVKEVLTDLTAGFDALMRKVDGLFTKKLNLERQLRDYHDRVSGSDCAF